MNKAELIEALADKTGLQKQEAKKVLDAYIEIVTGTPVMIPARTTVKFKPGKFLLEAMNAHLK